MSLNSDKLNGVAGPPLPPSTGYANWVLSEHGGLNMWTWIPTPDVRYGVTQVKADIQAHVTTGTRYKFSKTIGSYATVKEAKTMCEEHWHNDDFRHPPK
jgi:hypothetical protein